MPLDPSLLAALPVAREAAEKMAREWYAMYRAVASGPLLLWNPAPWESFSDVEREHHTRVQLDLLVDLSRPASCDAWVRLVEINRRGPCVKPSWDMTWPDDFRNNPEALHSTILRVFAPKEAPDAS